MRRLHLSGAALAAALCLALAAPAARAGEKPVVRLIFELAEREYRRQFGTDATALEQKALAELSKDLRGRILFLDFSDAQQDAVLRVVLGSATSGSEMHEVAFQMSLDGTDRVTGRSLSSPVLRWTYRPARAYADPLGGVDAFARDIGVMFAQGDHDKLVEEVLSQVPISHDGALVEQDPVPVWVIPFSQEELCMDFPSSLKIEHQVSTTTLRRVHLLRIEANGTSLQNRIAGTPSNPPPDQSVALNDVRGNPLDRNKVLAVYVLTYKRRDPSCSSVIRPSDSGLGGGGER